MKLSYILFFILLIVGLLGVLFAILNTFHDQYAKYTIPTIHDATTNTSGRSMNDNWAQSEYKFKVDSTTVYTITCVNGTKWLLTTNDAKQMLDIDGKPVRCTR